MPQADAEAEITDSGLVVGIITEEYSETVAVGSVVSQNLSAGETVPLLSTVDLVIS